MSAGADRRDAALSSQEGSEDADQRSATRPSPTTLTAFGARLLGSPDQPGRRLARRVQALLTIAVVLANVIGAVAVTAIAAVLHGGVQRFEEAGVLLLNVIAVPTYALGSLVVGVAWGTVRVRRQLVWVRADAEPDQDDQRAALRVPIELTRIQAALWGIAAVVFSVLNGIAAVELGLEVLLHVVIGGAVVSAIAYLLAELIMRPIAARALQRGVPQQLHVPGVTARQLLASGLGLLPVAGLMTVGISSLVREDLDTTQLGIAIVVLGGVSLCVGGLLAWLAARATADPIKGLREATAELDRGNLDVEVSVYDGTEIGLLQAGFNRAIAGLRERERMRDLFGRHVGEEVAREAMDRGAELGGEALEVAVLFADVVGSTELAAQRPPEEVVEVLNQFFGVVVDVVDESGGYVDKFAGDAVLAVFGAPVPAADAATRALSAGRTIAERLADEVTDLDVGIGIAAGRAVAGNVGHARRLEYTVIGDPVNEAARLSDAAKQRAVPVLASMRAVEAASAAEAERWRADEDVVLRGRQEPTRLAAPT